MNALLQEQPDVQTHEAYIGAIRLLATARVADTKERATLDAAKLVYGTGMPGTRGVTFFSAWKKDDTEQAFVEICAGGEESDVQIAGTTVHELAHVLAGHTAGHGKEWKAACKVLGLISAEASGQAYAPDHFDAQLWQAIEKLQLPNDGGPVFRAAHGLGGVSGLPTSARVKPCPLGIGTRGGKSRGKGSGSRLRLYTCSCNVKVRVASDDFQATCDRCHEKFTQPGPQAPAQDRR